MNKFSKITQKQIFLPQDHGSWVFIISPLIIGLFAGKNVNVFSIILICACAAAFLIRQPITILIKSFSGRRPGLEPAAAWFWICTYGFVIVVSALLLLYSDKKELLLLALPAVPVFIWQLLLISRREERKQIGLEILGTGVLSLAAPAAFWIGSGHYDSTGWFLWILVWFQSAASIVYAYLRLTQRQWKENPSLRSRIWTGWRAIAYTTFNLGLSILLVSIGKIPGLIWAAFLVQFLESIWGTIKPAINAKPVSIGMRQLIISSLFTIIFISTWR